MGHKKKCYQSTISIAKMAANNDIQQWNPTWKPVIGLLHQGQHIPSKPRCMLLLKPTEDKHMSVYNRWKHHSQEDKEWIEPSVVDKAGHGFMTGPSRMIETSPVQNQPT